MTEDVDTELSQLIARALARLQKVGIVVDDDLAVRVKLTQLAIVRGLRLRDAQLITGFESRTR